MICITVMMVEWLFLTYMRLGLLPFSRRRRRRRSSESWVSKS